MTAIDIVISLYQILNVNAVTSLLGSGKVWQHNRPLNSPYTDVVISVPEYINSDMTTGYVDINIHTPNPRNLKPINTEDFTFPDMPKLKSVTDAVLPLISNLDGYNVVIAGVPIRDKDGQWYSQIRLNFQLENTNLSKEIELYHVNSSSDGFGGVNTTSVKYWGGNASQQNIGSGTQLNINSGRYEFNLRCDWVVPDSVSVSKNSQIIAPDGIYVINGIKPEGSYFRLSAVRKDLKDEN